MDLRIDRSVTSVDGDEVLLHAKLMSDHLLRDDKLPWPRYANNSNPTSNFNLNQSNHKNLTARWVA